MKQICLLITLLSTLSGCMSAPSPNPPPAAKNPAHQLEDLSRCIAPANKEMKDFNSVVDWINAMPKPVTLACFIASLPRPLYFNATSSRSSVQPAIGKLNPRIFIQYDKLWLSFVPHEAMSAVKDPVTGERKPVWDADGIQLLEFSLEVPADLPAPQSIKGELAFPIYTNLPRNAPYDRIALSDVDSACTTCHGNETRVGELDGVPIFRSKMLRSANQFLMQPNDILLHYFACDPAINTGPGEENNEWYRCQMLKAFVDRGPIEWQNFRNEITPSIQE